MTRIRVALAVLALAQAVTGRAEAQGALSAQGLGYPPGQLSTRARTTGGALGEIDPLSPLNPAALGLLNTPLLAFQAEPEYRRLQVGSESVTSSISRFPLIAGALPLGSRWTVGLAVSTLLDRTFQTTVRDTQDLGGEQVTGETTERSEGSISDIRLALSFAPSPWFRVGIGAHALSGSDVLTTTRVFDDTVRFARDAQRAVVGFGGKAVSAGALAIFPRVAAIGLGYRHGGRINAYDGNTVVGTGNAPSHMGVTVAYLGLRGSTLGVRAARDDWSRLEGMTPSLHIHEGWDIGVGADVTGPRFGASALGLRAGARWRTLPFSSTGSPISEQTWSGGFALPLGRFLGQSRAVEVSMGLLRSSRTSDPIGGIAVSEKAWTLSTGFSVRP
jgi:hypothetical protein